MSVNNPDPTYYEILNVPETASVEEIEKAFKIARRDNHPHKGSPEWAFRQVTKAYETLKDENKRKLYDHKLKFGDQPEEKPKPKPPEPKPDPPKTEQKPRSNPPTRRPESRTTSYRPVTETPVPVTTEDEDIVQVAEYENNFSELEKYSFKPSQFAILPFVGVGAGLLLIGSLILAFSWDFPTYPVTIGGVAIIAALVGAGLQLARQEKNANKISIALLIISWILVGVPLSVFLSQPTDKPVYLAGFVLFLVGGMVTTLFLRKYKDIIRINKIVPVKTLRNARIYGSPVGESEQTAAMLRNISSTLQQVTNYVDGTFLLHLKGLPLHNNEYAPVNLVLLNGSRMAAVSLIYAPPGNYAVDDAGNLIQRFEGGFKHIPNRNPEVLMALRTVKSQFKDIEAKSFVIVVNNSFKKVTPYKSATTEVFSRNDGVKVLAEYFKDSDLVVRRDILTELTPLITV